jgi:hypothetical protein
MSTKSREVIFGSRIRGPPVHLIPLTTERQTARCLTLGCIRMMRGEGPAGWNRGDPYDHFNQRRPALPRLCRQRIARAS